ncbi:MAG: hypothetical protein QXQ57_03670 [Sulfolobales archaeon]
MSLIIVSRSLEVLWRCGLLGWLDSVYVAHIILESLGIKAYTGINLFSQGLWL